jgi:hypothetical protein
MVQLIHLRSGGQLPKRFSFEVMVAMQDLKARQAG